MDSHEQVIEKLIATGVGYWLAEVVWDEFAPLLAEARREAWDEGEASGWSRAMRNMSDEPTVQRAANPHRAARVRGDHG